MTQTNKTGFNNPSTKQAPTDKPMPTDKTQAGTRSPSEGEEQHRQGGNRVPDQNDRKSASDKKSS